MRTERRSVVVVEERPTEDLVYEIEPAVQDELLRYPGKWAAITRTEIIAVRDNSTDAYQAALALGVGSPILFHVADGHPRSYYY
jgi:hypothetical protein